MAEQWADNMTERVGQGNGTVHIVGKPGTMIKLHLREEPNHPAFIIPG